MAVKAVSLAHKLGANPSQRSLRSTLLQMCQVAEALTDATADATATESKADSELRAAVKGFVEAAQRWLKRWTTSPRAAVSIAEATAFSMRWARILGHLNKHLTRHDRARKEAWSSRQRSLAQRPRSKRALVSIEEIHKAVDPHITRGTSLTRASQLVAKQLGISEATIRERLRAEAGVGGRRASVRGIPVTSHRIDRGLGRTDVRYGSRKS